MKWCCMGFEGNFQTAGARGFGVFVSKRSGSEPEFILQHRSLDPGAPTPNFEYPISLVSDVRMRFCPWCGVSLRDWYRSATEDLDRSELKVRL